MRTAYQHSLLLLHHKEVCRVSPVCLVHAGLDGTVNALLALLHALDGGVQVLASLGTQSSRSRQQFVTQILSSAPRVVPFSSQADSTAVTLSSPDLVG